MKRIVVVGGSCCGKTTFSKTLSQILSIQHVELDALHWEPNWKESPTEIFRERVQNALLSSRWVVDGNYSKVSDLIWPKADTIIWLDMPLLLILWRFVNRSFKRSFTNEELWNGNRESLKNSIFQKNSLLAWILKTHNRRRNQYLSFINRPPYPNLKFIKLKSVSEIRHFLGTVKGDTVEQVSL
jgi:adenylate kinase family enzyme